jgi:hypothetical protein
MNCEYCHGHKFVIVHGVINEAIKMPCRCQKNKNYDVHRELVIKDNKVLELK